MAKVDYPIYKIRRDPHSKKVQSLAVGDVVRRIMMLRGRSIR